MEVSIDSRNPSIKDKRYPIQQKSALIRRASQGKEYASDLGKDLHLDISTSRVRQVIWSCTQLQKRWIFAIVLIYDSAHM